MRDVHHCSGPPPRLQNDLYCVVWDVKLYYTIRLNNGIGQTDRWTEMVKQYHANQAGIH